MKMALVTQGFVNFVLDFATIVENFKFSELNLQSCRPSPTTLSAVVFGIGIATIGAFLRSQSNEYFEQRNQAYANLNQYGEALGSFGCGFDPDNPQGSMENTRECLNRIKDLQKERDVGYALAGSLKTATSLAITVGSTEENVIAMVSRYFGQNEAELKSQKAFIDSLNNHLSSSLGNVKQCLGLSEESHHQFVQCQTNLTLCEVSNAVIKEQLESNKQNLEECSDTLKMYEKTLNTTKTERNDFATKYQNCSTHLNAKANKKSTGWFW